MPALSGIHSDDSILTQQGAKKRKLLPKNSAFNYKATLVNREHVCATALVLIG
jgi:hypothetical protein